ncbi:MAG: hypothetical protein ACP5KW_10290 [Thermoproteota archaeon]
MKNMKGLKTFVAQYVIKRTYFTEKVVYESNRTEVIELMIMLYIRL